MKEISNDELVLQVPDSWCFAGRLGWAHRERPVGGAHQAGAFVGYHAGLLLFSSMLFLTASRKLTVVRQHTRYSHLLLVVGAVLLVNLARRLRRSGP